MKSLLDINLWLALVFESYVHHPDAVNWFHSQRAECAFCRATQQGFLRIATNPKAFGEEAVTLAEAWELYDRLMALPNLVFVDEPPDIEPLWRNYTLSKRFSPKVWNDAYLAAFACATSSELITFDRGFTKFPALRCKILA